MSELNLDLLKEGGAIALAGLLLVYTAWKDRMYNKTINNHMQHVETALTNVASSITKLSDVMTRYERVIDRVERILDKSV